MTTVEQVSMVRPGDGAEIPIVGMRHKVDPESFAGALGIVEGAIPPGTLIPPHTHSHEDECFYVLEGSLSFDLDGTVEQAAAGTYVIRPRGIPHAFWNSGSAVARVMVIHTPGAFVRMYDELDALSGRTDLDPESRRREERDLIDRWGLTFHWERVPEIADRYHVRP
jgi:quercetin dioxygenase-like cupin family protein